MIELEKNFDNETNGRVGGLTEAYTMFSRIGLGNSQNPSVSLSYEAYRIRELYLEERNKIKLNIIKELLKIEAKLSQNRIKELLKIELDIILDSFKYYPMENRTVTGRFVVGDDFIDIVLGNIKKRLDNYNDELDNYLDNYNDKLDEIINLIIAKVEEEYKYKEKSIPSIENINNKYLSNWKNSCIEYKKLNEKIIKEIDKAIDYKKLKKDIISNKSIDDIIKILKSNIIDNASEKNNIIEEDNLNDSDIVKMINDLIEKVKNDYEKLKKDANKSKSDFENLKREKENAIKREKENAIKREKEKIEILKDFKKYYKELQNYYINIKNGNIKINDYSKRIITYFSFVNNKDIAIYPYNELNDIIDNLDNYIKPKR